MNKFYFINQPIKKKNEFNDNNKDKNEKFFFSSSNCNKINILTPSDIKYKNFLFSEKFQSTENECDSPSTSTIDNSHKIFKKKRRYYEMNKNSFPNENNNFNNENEFLKKECKYN